MNEFGSSTRIALDNIDYLVLLLDFKMEITQSNSFENYARTIKIRFLQKNVAEEKIDILRRLINDSTCKRYETSSDSSSMSSKSRSKKRKYDEAGFTNE